MNNNNKKKNKNNNNKTLGSVNFGVVDLELIVIAEE